MRKLVVKYGLIGGILCSGLGLLNWFLVAPNTDPATTQLLGYFAAILALLCVPLGIIYFRDKLNKGVISFVQGFKIGLGISLILSLVVFGYSLLFFLIVGDDYNEWKFQQLSTESSTEMDRIADSLSSLWLQSLIVFLSVFLIGLIISLISSLLLKRTKTT